MKVPYICLYLFILGIEAQRRIGNPDITNPSTSPRTRGRGRAKFSLSTDAVQAETGYEIPSRGSNRRKEEQKRTDNPSPSPNFESRSSRPLAQPLDSKPYEVKEVLDETPLKSNKEEVTLPETPEVIDVLSSSTESLDSSEINKITNDDIKLNNNQETQTSLEESIQNDIGSSSSRPENIRSNGLPPVINEKSNSYNQPEPSLQSRANKEIENQQPLARRKVTRKRQRVEIYDGLVNDGHPMTRDRSSHVRSKSSQLENESVQSNSRDATQSQLNASPEYTNVKTATTEVHRVVGSATESPQLERKERRLPQIDLPIVRFNSQKTQKSDTSASNQERRAANVQKNRRIVSDEVLSSKNGNSERRRSSGESAHTGTNWRTDARSEQLTRSNVNRPRGNGRRTPSEEPSTSQKPRTRSRASQLPQESTTAKGRTRGSRIRSDIASTSPGPVSRDSIPRTRTGRKIVDSLTSESIRSTRIAELHSYGDVNENKRKVSSDTTYKSESSKENFRVPDFDNSKEERTKGRSREHVPEFRTTTKEPRNIRSRGNRRDSAVVTDKTSSPRRSRSRNLSTTKFEVLPLFASESNPIPTKAYPPSDSKTNLNSEKQQQTRRRNEEKKTEAATTPKPRVTRRQVNKSTVEETGKVTDAAKVAEESSASKRAQAVKKSVKVSEVTQVTSTRKIGRRRKNSKNKSKKENSGDDSTSEKSNQTIQTSKGRKSNNKIQSELNKSEEELNESDNYPEPFKSIIKAKKQKEKSSKSKTTEQAKVTEKLQIVTPYTTPITSSVTPSSSSAAPVIEHLYLRKDEEKENELEANRSTVEKPKRKHNPKNEKVLNEISKKQIETTKQQLTHPLKKPVNAISTTTTETPKPVTKTSQKKKSRYHARYKSSTPRNAGDEIVSSTRGSTPKTRGFSPKPTGTPMNTRRFEKSTTARSYNPRSTTKTYSKFNKINKETKSVPQASAGSKQSGHRYSSRYRNESLKKNSKLLGSTPGPKYIPTVPPVRGQPITEIQKHGNDEVQILIYDDPVNNIVPSDNLISGDYLLSANKTNSNSVDSDQEETRQSTTSKPIPVSIFESIINSITSISSTPKTATSQTISTERPSTSSAIFRIASKKTKTDRTLTPPTISSENLVKGFSASTTEKSTTIIEKILSSLTAIKANDSKESTIYDPYENDTIYNTVNTTPQLPITTSKLSIKSTRSLGTSTTLPRLNVAQASTTINSVNNNVGNASLDEMLQKRNITRLFSLLNSITYTSPKPLSSSDNLGSSLQLNTLTSTSPFPLVSQSYSKITKVGMPTTETYSQTPSIPSENSKVPSSTTENIQFNMPADFTTTSENSKEPVISSTVTNSEENIISSSSVPYLTNLDQNANSDTISSTTSYLANDNDIQNESTTSTTATSSTTLLPHSSKPSKITTTQKSRASVPPTLSTRIQDILNRLNLLLNSPTTGSPVKRTTSNSGYSTYRAPASVSVLPSTTGFPPISLTNIESTTINSNQATRDDTSDGRTIIFSSSNSPRSAISSSTTSTITPTKFPLSTSSLSPLSTNEIFKQLSTMPPTLNDQTDTPSPSVSSTPQYTMENMLSILNSYLSTRSNVINSTTLSTTTPFPVSSSSLSPFSTSTLFKSLETNPPVKTSTFDFSSVNEKSTTPFPVTTSSLSSLSTSDIFKSLASNPPKATTSESNSLVTKTVTPYPSSTSSLSPLSTSTILNSLGTTPPTRISSVTQSSVDRSTTPFSTTVSFPSESTSTTVLTSSLPSAVTRLPNTKRVTPKITQSSSRSTYSPGFLEFLNNLINSVSSTAPPYSRSLPTSSRSLATTTGNPLSIFNSLFSIPTAPSQFSRAATPTKPFKIETTTASTPTTVLLSKATLPEHVNFEVSPGSVSIISANDVSSTYKPEEFDSAVSIISKNIFPYLTTKAPTTSTTGSQSEENSDIVTTTGSISVTILPSTNSSTISITDFPDSTFVLPSTTFSNEISTTESISTTDLTSEVSTIFNEEDNTTIITLNTNSTDNIDTTESNTMTNLNNSSMSPTREKDFFIFAILNNNTILRKRPSMYPTRETPFIIKAILPNNTLVQKFPNGSLVPEEPVVQVNGFDTREIPPPPPEITSNQVTSVQDTRQDNMTDPMVEVPSNSTTISTIISSTENATIPPLNSILGGKIIKEFNNLVNKTPSENEVFKYQTLDVDQKGLSSTSTTSFPVSSKFFTTTTPLSTTSGQPKLSVLSTRSSTTARSTSTTRKSTTTSSTSSTSTSKMTTTTTSTTTTKATPTTTIRTKRPTSVPARRKVTSTTPSYIPGGFLSTLLSTLQTLQPQRPHPTSYQYLSTSVSTTTPTPLRTTSGFKVGSRPSTLNSIDDYRSSKSTTEAFRKSTTPSPGIFDDIFRTIITARPPTGSDIRETSSIPVATSTKRSINTVTTPSNNINDLELLNSLFKNIIPSGNPLQQYEVKGTSSSSKPTSTDSITSAIRKAALANEISAGRKRTKPVYTTERTTQYTNPSFVPINIDDEEFRRFIQTKTVPTVESDKPSLNSISVTSSRPSSKKSLRDFSTTPTFTRPQNVPTTSSSTSPPIYYSPSANSIDDDIKPTTKPIPGRINIENINPQVLSLLEQLLLGGGLNGSPLSINQLQTSTTTTTTTTTRPTTTTTTPTTTTTRTTTTTTPKPERPPRVDISSVNLDDLKKKNLTEEQRKDLLTLEALEREQKNIMKQLSFLASLAGLRGGLGGATELDQENLLAGKDELVSKKRDDKPKLSSTASPLNLLDSLPSSSFNDQKKINAGNPNTLELANLLKQINLINGEKVTTVLPKTTYGKSEEALLASLLKENGIGPTTPKSLGERIRQAGLFEKEATTTSTSPRPKTTRRQRVLGPTLLPASRGPLMQGLSWILNAFSPERTGVPPLRPAKSANSGRLSVAPKPPIYSATTRSSRSTTESSVSDLDKSVNSLSDDQLDSVIGQLAQVQKSGKGSHELDLTLKKLLDRKNDQSSAYSNQPTKVEIITPANSKAVSISRPMRYTTSKPDSITNFISNAGLDYHETPSPPVKVDPVAEVGQDTPPVRGQLVNAAINVTKAISSFLGSALQGAASSFQTLLQSGSRQVGKLSSASSSVSRPG